MKDINSATDNKDWLEIPTGPTGVRPSNPVAGQMRFDTTQSVLEYYNPSVTGWRGVTNSAADIAYVTATGGDSITTDGDYKVHTFLSSANFIVSDAGSAEGSSTVEILLVAGGGSGGNSSVTSNSSTERGGGGGAGGYRTFAAFAVSATTYAMVIGAGASSNSDGSNSTGFGYSSTGGGAGAYHALGSYPAVYIGRNGGSGGGGMWVGSNVQGGKGTGNLGSYTPVEGYDGGLAAGGYYGGGGGGSSAAGTDSVTGTGGGGAGTVNTINGSSVTYAAGGDVATAAAGTANRGNGGASNTPNTSGYINGGSGIIIVRYKFQN